MRFPLNEFENIVCAVLFLGMTLVGFIIVVVRYATHYSFAASEELLNQRLFAADRFWRCSRRAARAAFGGHDSSVFPAAPRGSGRVPAFDNPLGPAPDGFRLVLLGHVDELDRQRHPQLCARRACIVVSDRPPLRLCPDHHPLPTTGRRNVARDAPKNGGHNSGFDISIMGVGAR
ncbi:hypothetical protein [Sulfitobacter sp. 915]|uniref:hypothetical protein n=1 Tax=Sulfitobacter sp. 915 TaxID=3368558 RepID=UPI003744CDCA